jgi:hypothetical protein
MTCSTSGCLYHTLMTPCSPCLRHDDKQEQLHVPIFKSYVIYSTSILPAKSKILVLTKHMTITLHTHNRVAFSVFPATNRIHARLYHPYSIFNMATKSRIINAEEDNLTSKF